MEKIEMEKKKDISKEFEKDNESLAKYVVGITDRFAIILVIGLILILCLRGFVFGRTQKYEIIAISSNDIFTLGVGNLGKNEYFVCYTEDENGKLQLKTFSSENTTICKTLESNQEAYVEITTKFSGTKNKLYVPKDMIQIEYNLSLTE